MKKGLVLENVESNTIYRACTFYLNEYMNYKINNTTFDNCSFRTRVRFSHLKNCKFQNCNFTQLLRIEDTHGELPQGLFTLFSLKNLNLSYNFLKKLPDEIGQLSQLRRLTLTFDCLEELPSNIINLSALQYLSIESNLLAEVPKEIFGLSLLENLSLRDG